MWEEKKIVSWALIILFLSLTIVYSLVYMRKKDVFVNTSLHSGENAQGTEDNQ
jgi:preprotein translocase subunit SecG